MKKFMFLFSFLICACSMNEQRKFNFTYTVNIEPTNGKKLELWVPIPKSNDVQKISNLTFNTHELQYEINTETDHGNKYLYILEEGGITEEKTISMTFDVLRNEHQNVMYENVDPNQYMTSYNSVPTGSVFTTIIKENQLTKTNIRGIYDYVLSGMHYGKPKSVDNKYYQSPWLFSDSSYGRNKVSRDEVVLLYQKAVSENIDYTFGNGNSIYACDIGVGNCTDYHSYFMSLGRTLEIPIRFHMGFSIPENSNGPVGGYHCWADFYIEGEGWYPVDISEADKHPEKADYYFGSVCSNRVDMMVGRDFILKGYEDKIVNLFIYPLLEVGDEVSTAFSKQFLFKNI